MLKIAIPKGSLQKGTFNLFKKANMPILQKGDRSYELVINDPRIDEALLLRPQQIPKFVEDGEFDLAICGKDWVYETESNVKEVLDLKFSRQGWSIVNVVLATDISNPITDVKEIDVNSKVVTELPRTARRYFKSIDKGKISILLSYGATEAQVPRFAEYLIDITETGETLRRNNKKILKTIFKSSTKLIANIDSYDEKKNPEKKQAIDEIAMLLKSVVDAVGKVLIKMNIPASKTQDLIKVIPALRLPTVSSILFADGNNHEEWKMVETVVEKDKLNILIPKVKAIGAQDIIELDIAKMIR